ncbi:UNVERIFIED_CONTAM: hypothetical protein Sindi_0732000 [Sesamum indicum]
MSSSFSSNSGSSSNSGLGSSATSLRSNHAPLPAAVPSPPKIASNSLKSKHPANHPAGPSTLEKFQDRMRRNPWAAIVSAVKLPIHKIRERYYIPHDYEIMIPRSFDRMHQPPSGFCAFSLQHFDAGLRFPLAPSVASTLRR